MYGKLRELTGGYFYQAFVGLVAGIAGVCGSFAVAGSTQGFVGVRMSSILINNTPGSVVDLVLENLGKYGQPFAFVSAVLLSVALIGGLSFGGIVFGRYANRKYVSAVFAFLLTALVVTAMTGVFVASFAAAFVAGGVVALFDYRYEDEGVEFQPKPDVERRRALQASAGTIGFAGASYLAGRFRTPMDDEEFLGRGSSPPLEVQRMLDEADEKSLELADAPGLVSEIGEFYQIDINTVNPRVNRDEWRLNFTGQVDDETTLTYDELTSMTDESEHRFISLRCVGDDLNGRQMDNSVWTGVPLEPLVEEAGANSDYVVMHGYDDFFNTVPTEVLRNGFLAYGMNGRLLPRGHGHPVRILLPGHWGEVNVKWVREVEFVSEDGDGYWERRGWDGTGRVKPVAKIWSAEALGDGRVRVGGHAYAGLDGVRTVEVSTDGGETWNEATLSERLDTEDRDVWRQWAYDWEAEEEEYEVVARMTDDNGNPQTEERSGSSPDGATGWVSRTVRPHSLGMS
ncbi:MAG: molybdopterin-dependent oxidoreductase [Halobacteriales archaeon]|nr:molybdopterin-dependent oxidoreductase [Halobacteriales archaeon]